MNGNLFEVPEPPAVQASGEWLTAHCDGGSRGNPGPSGYGAVIEDAHGHLLAELSEFLGVQTNNYAEYSGLVAVLKWANENGTKYLRVVSDSELMVKQMKGQYKVKRPNVGLGSSNASRCATPYAAATSKPTVWPTRPWIGEWEKQRVSESTGERAFVVSHPCDRNPPRQTQGWGTRLVYCFTIQNRELPARPLVKY